MHVHLQMSVIPNTVTVTKHEWSETLQGVPKKTGICGKLSLRAIGLSLSKKLAHFWRIHEILHLIDTKIVQFDPLGAEKIESKDGNPT